MRRLILPLGVVSLLAAIIILSATDDRTTETNGGPRVAATIFPLADITRHVAGEAIDVVQILPPGADPHTFEPTPALLAELSGSRHVFTVGYGLDDWVELLFLDTGIPSSTVDDGIALRASSEDGGVDPHYWLTIPHAKIIAQNVARQLAVDFPEHAESIMTNLEIYQYELDSADARIRSILAAMENTRIVTMHDAWYYFAHEYGLTIAGTFEPTAGREPTPQWLASLAGTMHASGLSTLFLEAGQSNLGVESFASDNGLTLLTLDPEGVSGAYSSYIDLMQANALTLAQNR